MSPYIRIVVLILCIASFVALRPQRVSALTVQDLLKQRDTLSREIERNKQEAEKKKQEAAKISTDIKKIDGDVSTTEKRIMDTESSLDQTQKDITSKTLDITLKENELAKELANQREALRVIYETTGENWAYLLVSNDITEAINRVSYLEALEVRIESTIDLVTHLRDDLVTQKNNLVTQQKSLESLKKQTEAYRQSLDYQKSKKNELLSNAKNAQASYQQKLEEAKKAYQDVNSELYKLQEAARKRATTRGGSKRTNNIVFGWPLSGEFTTHFGEPTPFQSFHTGLDIDGVIGDPIVAAADGKVNFTGGNSRYGYGLYVTIDHGDGIASLYGHMSGIEVSSGDQVKQGDRIGFVGNTGFAISLNGGDGSHLHFEIREDNIPVDPAIYLP